MLKESVVRFNQQICPQLHGLIGKGRGSVCVEAKGFCYGVENCSNAYRSTIAIMILITIILPVYCNIIDALVQVTSLIFLQRILMK